MVSSLFSSPNVSFVSSYPSYVGFSSLSFYIVSPLSFYIGSYSSLSSGDVCLGYSVRASSFFSSVWDGSCWFGYSIVVSVSPS